MITLSNIQKEDRQMGIILTLAFLVALGPLAIKFGVDSRGLCDGHGLRD
jgi:hypothetical protein